MGRLGWGKFILADRCSRAEAGCASRRVAGLLAGVAAVSLGVVSAGAQESADSQTAEPQEFSGVITQLDRITVVSRTGETPIDTLASVSQVAGEELERRQATTPADILFGVPGVAVQADAKRAASSINVRGLQDFGRVAVIVDGARQNFQRSGHGSQSLFFIDPELVEQVDVVRGPVANTYGSGAIGGVVVFETKDAEDFLREDETHALSTTGRYETNGNGWTTSAVGAYRISDAADIIGNIVWRDFGDYKDGGGDRVEGTGFDVLSGLVKTTIRPTEFSELKLGWVGTQDNWTETSGSVPAYDANLEQNTFTARYNLTDPDRSWLDLHVNTSVNMAGHSRTFLIDQNQLDPVTGVPVVVPAGSRTSYDLDTYSFDIWNTSRFETGAVSHELTYGGDWLTDDVVTTSPVAGDDPYTPSGKRTVSGAYVQNKMTYDWLEVIGALRYDSYELEDGTINNAGDRLSPRITVGVSPFDTAALSGLQFYGTYAEGYRSPSVTETLISGLHPVPAAPFRFLPNPDLQPETAKTIEFGVNYALDGMVYADDSLRLKAAYFDNDVDDYIGEAFVPPFAPGSGCFSPPFCIQYQNFASASIRGFEMEAVYDAGRFFGGLSASIIDGHTVDDGGLREDLLTIPSSQVTAQLGLRFLEGRLTVGGEVQYNGAPDGNDFADDYTLVNAFASYHHNENFRFDVRADNLFDVKYRNPLNASVTTDFFEPGLNLKFAATMRFGG